MMRKQTKITTAIVIGVVLVVGIVLLSLYPSERVEPSDETEVVIHNEVGVPNPAGGLCRALGYEPEYHQSGGSYCIFPDKTRCEQWAFYKGECGQEWSYCALKGYDVETRDDGKDLHSIVYSFCIDKESGEDIGIVSELVNQEFESKFK